MKHENSVQTISIPYASVVQNKLKLSFALKYRGTSLCVNVYFSDFFSILYPSNSLTGTVSVSAVSSSLIGRKSAWIFPVECCGTHWTISIQDVLKDSIKPNSSFLSESNLFPISFQS